MNGSTPLACFKLHIDYGISNSFTWNSNGFIDPSQFVPFDNWINDPYWASIASSVFASTYNIVYTIIVGQVLQAIISGNRRIAIKIIL